MSKNTNKSDQYPSIPQHERAVDPEIFSSLEGLIERLTSQKYAPEGTTKSVGHGRMRDLAAQNSADIFQVFYYDSIGRRDWGDEFARMYGAEYTGVQLVGQVSAEIERKTADGKDIGFNATASLLDDGRIVAHAGAKAPDSEAAYTDPAADRCEDFATSLGLQKIWNNYKMSTVTRAPTPQGMSMSDIPVTYDSLMAASLLETMQAFTGPA